MRKFTNLLVALLALFGAVISARADVISPVGVVIYAVKDNILAIVLVIVVVIVTLTLLRIFRKK